MPVLWRDAGLPGHVALASSTALRFGRTRVPVRCYTSTEFGGRGLPPLEMVSILAGEASQWIGGHAGIDPYPKFPIDIRYATLSPPAPGFPVNPLEPTVAPALDPETVDPSLRIFLIRHGETEWSLSGRHTGRTDIALTARGEQMARALAPGLADVSFSAVLTSPRRRAQDTCALAGLGALAQIEPDLAEWDYGDDEGRRSSEIAVDRPDWDIWRDGCPGGETPAQVAARADRLVQRLRGLSGNIAIFSHGHFGRALATRWIQLPISAGRSLILEPATLSLLGIDDRHASTPVILRWNAEP